MTVGACHMSRPTSLDLHRQPILTQHNVAAHRSVTMKHGDRATVPGRESRPADNSHRPTLITRSMYTSIIRWTSRQSYLMRICRSCWA